jgi:D-alanyl-D-alanine carboxypeptidase
MHVRADVLAAARAYVEGTELEVLVVSTGAHPLPRSGRWPDWRLLWLLVGLIAAAGTAVALDRTAFLGSQEVSSAPKDVQDSVQALVRGSVPGALLFVRQGDRSYTVTAGYAEKATKRPMRAGDTFPIGSTTKAFTAVLVMRLVAQGEIALDDPLSKYLPRLLPDGKRITIGELLSHTSGLQNFTDDTRFLAPYMRGNFGYAWTPKQMVAFAATSPLAFAPGTKFSYSNTNYVVLALLAERVGGKSYEKQLADYIFRPLKLDHTSLPASNKTLPDVHGYVGFRTRGKPDGAGNFDSAALTPAFGWSAGGIRATAKDEADFFRGLFSGKLLPAAQVAAMEDTSATGGVYGLGLMPTGGHESAWRAYTQAITTTCGRAWGHGGAFPGYYQLPISSPDGSRQAVLLVNTEEELLSVAQFKQVYNVLATAYCRGVPS